MKFFSVLFLSLFVLLSVGSQELLAVKLKTVVQTGTGKSGSIKIEFNNHYSKSDITVNYSADKVDLIIPNAFVVPVKRIFKGSSTKSSVAKMEAANISGRSLKLSIYFRGVPIDIIKKTAKLTGDGNVVSFNYFTSMEAAAAAPPQEQESAKEEVKAPTPLPVQEAVEAKAPETKVEIKNVVAEPVNMGQRMSFVSIVKKYLLALARFFKVAILIVLLGLVVFALFYILRKFSNKPYLNEPEQKVFGSTKVQNDPGIRIINKLEMEKDKTLYVIEVMGERMLVATGKDYVTMLSRLQNDTKDIQGSLFTETSSEVFHTRLKDKLNGF
jgi:flagellar biogenesis protein FliO